MINKKILTALSSLSVPISFQKYEGTSDTYITFHEYLQEGEEFDDDEETLTAHLIQVDIWSKTDYTGLSSQVKYLLGAAGLKRITEEDLYEPDTKIYHKGIRFFYLQEKEEE